MQAVDVQTKGSYSSGVRLTCGGVGSAASNIGNSVTGTSVTGTSVRGTSGRGAANAQHGKRIHRSVARKSRS